MIHAKYTVVLKTLMDSETVKPLLHKSLSTYPLYESEKAYDLIPSREELNARLLNHYKYREIGFETVGRFLDELEITMKEIMPRYNELLKTVVTMAELPSPFDNVDVVETFEQTRKNESTTDTTTESETDTSTESETESSASDTTTTSNSVDSNNKHVQSGTPQGNLSVPAASIENVSYADEVTWGKDHSASTGTSTSTGSSNASSTGSSNASTTESTNVKNDGTETTTHTYTKKGNQGVNTYAHDMNEFRTTIIDVVDQIIHDARINELFMLVY